MNRPEHLLAIRLSAMGDVAIGAPVFYAFAKAYPTVQLTVLTKPFFSPIIQAIPGVDTEVAMVKTTHKGFLGIWKLSRHLKEEQITKVADLHNVLRSKVLRMMLGKPSEFIQKGRAAKKELTRLCEDKELKPLQTSLQRYLEVFKKLGYPISESQLEPLPVGIISQSVAEVMKDFPKTWVGIAPFAAHLGKQYPLDLMREVLESLSKTADFALVLFGAPSEKEALDLLGKDLEYCVNLAGQFNFKQELSLISQLAVMLSMDSGNGHLSAMYGVPTVTLWGVTHPFAGFAPFMQESHTLLADRSQYPLIPTSVFGNRVPEGYENSMRSISPTKVVAKIKSLL